MPSLLNRRIKRVNRVPRPVPPNGLQLRYYMLIRSMLYRAKQLVDGRLGVRLPDLLARAAPVIRADAQPPGKRTNRIMDQVSASFYRIYPQERIEKLAKEIARSTSTFQRDQLLHQVRAATGVEISTLQDKGIARLISSFTAENVSLIESIPQTYFDDVEKRVLGAMSAGTRHEQLSEQLEERYKVAESSARLVARDQVLKFQGALNEVRQQSLGFDAYIWRATPDERTREVHKEFDGKRYLWSEPPGDGSPEEGTHPATGINCRCYAEPDVEGLLKSLED